MSRLVDITNQTVAEFLSVVAKKYSLDLNELKNDWTVFCEGNSTVGATNVASRTSSASGGVSGTCPYKFTKGAKMGQNCGVKTKVGDVYCKLHSKHEGKEQKEKKVLPQPKEMDKRTLVLNKTLDKMYHPSTGMVFKSKEDLSVIGKIAGNKIDKLTPTDIDICKRYGFKIDVKEENPVKTATAKKPVVAEVDSEVEVEEEVKKPEVKQNAKTATTTAKKPIVVEADSEEEKEEEVEEVKKPEVKPSAKPTAKKPEVKPSGKVASKKPVVVEADSEEEEVEEVKKPEVKPKPTSKVTSKKPVVVEEEVKKPATKSTKTVAKKASSDDEDGDDTEVEDSTTKISNKAVTKAMGVGSDDELVEEDN